QVVEMNPVPAPVSQDLALRAEQRMGGGLVLQGGTFPVRRNVPQFDFVPRSSNQGSVVGTEVATLDRVDVTGRSGTQLTGGHVPDLDSAFPPAGRHDLAVRTPEGRTTTPIQQNLPGGYLFQAHVASILPSQDRAVRREPDVRKRFNGPHQLAGRYLPELRA